MVDIYRQISIYILCTRRESLGVNVIKSCLYHGVFVKYMYTHLQNMKEKNCVHQGSV